MPISNQESLPAEFYQISQIENNLYLSGIVPLSSEGIERALEERRIGLIVSCLSRNQAVQASHRVVTSKYPQTVCLMVSYHDNLSQNLWDPIKAGNVSLTVSSQIGDRSPYVNRMREMANRSSGISSMEAAYRAIQIAQEYGVGVLVHCAAGVSRSASVLCYYLMTKYGWSYSQAVAFLQARRSIVSPNEEFRRQLIAYQGWMDARKAASRSN